MMEHAAHKWNNRLRSTLARLEPRPWHWLAATVAAFVIAGAVVTYAWMAGIRLEELAAFGYPGVFLVMLISGAGTYWPVPGQAAVNGAGTLLNPLLVGLAAGLGNATGELLGFAAGRAGAEVLGGRLGSRRWVGLRAWLSRHGFLAIFAMALVPNPVFDIVGLLAGSLGFTARRFWLACALGNSVKYSVMAYAGLAAVSWLGGGQGESKISPGAGPRARSCPPPG